MPMVYKIASRISSSEYLSFRFTRSEKSCVVYKLNEWAFPAYPKSYLFAFGSRDEAMDYLETETDDATTSLFRAEAPNVIKAYSAVPSAFDDGILTYWNEIAKSRNRERRAKQIGACLTPKGTVFCPSIKLIEKISKSRYRDTTKHEQS